MIISGTEYNRYAFALCRAGLKAIQQTNKDAVCMLNVWGFQAGALYWVVKQRLKTSIKPKFRHQPKTLILPFLYKI